MTLAFMPGPRDALIRPAALHFMSAHGQVRGKAMKPALAKPLQRAANDVLADRADCG
jgi:hypothetical protein